MYKWQTDGIISWRDGYYNSHPDLPLSVSTTEWDDAYAAFSGSWSLFGIVKGLLDLIAAIPTGRYWLDPVDNDSLTEPAGPALGARYLIPGTATAGANWLVDGPAGGPVQDCIAVCTGTGPSTWEYWGDPAVWGGAQDYDLNDGASLWNLYEDSYWVYDATGAAWIQCGGSTLEKVLDVTAIGTFTINDTTHRGTTFVVKQSGGTATLVLPTCADGLIYRVIKDTATGSGDHVEVMVPDLSSVNIFLQQRQFVLDMGGTPVYLDQVYRKFRIVSRGDSVYLLGTKDGWVIVDALATITDRSPQDAGTAQGAGDATHITLQAGASANNHEYNGRLVFITACPGVPAAVGQIRLITAYAGATKIATVSPAWTTTPDATAVYEMVKYDSIPVGMGELGSCYSQDDMDNYSDAGGALNSNNFPTISRYAGLNSTETWGALLLGRTQRALEGAKYASAFGYGGNARWDSQFLFGSPAPTASVKDPQVSRVMLYGTPKNGGVAEPMRLGTGAGETELTMDNSRLYYVTFSIAVTYGLNDPPKLISWSGSFLALCNYMGAVSIVAGSENITETGNLNSPAITLDISAASGLPQFLLANSESLDQAKAVGFADIIEIESAGAPS